MWSKLLKKTLLITLCLVCKLGFAQTQNTDTLNALLEQQRYDKVINIADSLIAQELSPAETLKIYTLQADAYFALGDIENTLKCYLNGLELIDEENHDDHETLLLVYSYTGYCYAEFDLHQEALHYYNKSLTIATVLQDSIEIASAYYNLSSSQLKVGQLNEAVDNLERAYSIDLARKDTSAISFDLNAMGFAKLIEEQYDEAIIFYKRSIDFLSVSSSNHNSLGSRYNNIGVAYKLLQQWDSARFYINESIKQHEKLKDSLNLAERWINMSELLIAQGNYNEAIDWSNKAKKYLSKVRRNNQVSSLNFSLIKANMGLKKYNDALLLANENITINQNLSSLANMVFSIELRAKINEGLNRNLEALADYKLLQQLKDSLLNRQNSERISELEVKYRVDDITQANKILNLENEVAIAKNEQQSSQLKLLFYSLILILIAAIAITYALFTRHKLKQNLLTTEINDLRNQIKVALEGDTSSLQIESINESIATPLTERETEILNYALSDMSNSEIAEKTFVSVNTVKYHLKKIYEKIGVTSRKEALQFALKSGK